VVEPADETHKGPPPRDVTEYGPKLPVARGRNLSQAVLTSVFLALVAGASYAAGATYFFWLAAVVILAAEFELLDAIRRSGRRPATGVALVTSAGALVAAYFYPERPELLLVGLASAVFLSLLLVLRPARGGHPTDDAAWSVLAVVWIGGCGVAACSILTLAGGLNMLVAHVLTTAFDDIAAYFVGTRFGRHKLAPSLSPSKSWEGLVAGFIGALAGGLLFGALIPELDVVDGVVIGLIIGLLAPAGDLVESAAKRELGIKDSSRLLPGHGGFLDRLDAVLFCAPAVLVYLRAFGL
jgi:phosphatidate cytidylyltransferase